jgi:DNA-binding CsgD family transcriptional regulator
MFISTTDQPADYLVYLRFAEKFSPLGFKGIDPQDPLLLEAGLACEKNNQYFVVADTMGFSYVFCSSRSSLLVGLDPVEITPRKMFERAHPDDLERHKLSRIKLFSLAHELFLSKTGMAYLSTDLRLLNPTGRFSNFLFQCYLFVGTDPDQTVWSMNVVTNIDWWHKSKHFYHLLVTEDLSNFHFPDPMMLKTGYNFSRREFEIIRLIAHGLSSDQIADKLFLSRNTVNAHRGNILRKSGINSMFDLINELIQKGLL